MIFKWLNNNIQFALDICVALLVFFVPISPALPNILMAPAGVLTIFLILKKKEFNQPVFWYLLICFTLSLLFQAFLVDDFLIELDFQRRLIAGVFIFTLVSYTIRLRLLERAFLLGLLLATFYSVLMILFNLFQNPEFTLGVGKNVNNALILERPYFAFATVMGNYIIFRNIRCSNYSKYYYILVFIFGFFCFFISARLGIALHIILFFNHTYRTIESIKIKHVLLGFFSLTIIAFAMAKNPYLKERMRISENWEATFKKIKTYEPRFVIWPCSYNSIKTIGIAGHHSHEQLNKELVECYGKSIKNKSKRDYYLKEEFNTHNQYFDALLTGGIISFLLFIAAFIWPFISKHKYDQMLGVFLLFMAFFMVENVFLRQTGCFLFGIFAALGYNYDRQKN